MNLQKLRNYESDEREKIRAICSQLLRRQGAEYPRLDLYPEFKDKLKGKVYTNALWGISVLIQLPFYDTIIMPVPRTSTEDEYRKSTGLSIDDTMELIDEGKILPIIFETLTNYRGLDYLDPILERRFPRCREVSFRSLITKISKYPEAKIKGLRTTLEKKDSKLERFLKSEKKGSKYGFKIETLPTGTNFEFSVDVSSFTKKNKSERINGLLQIYQLLRGLVGDSVVSSLLELPANLWFLVTAIYAENLIYHPSLALDGIVSIERDKFISHRVLNLFLREKTPASGRVFPIEIGKWLIEKCQLVDVRDLGFKKVIEMSKETAKARKALCELDKAVENRQSQKVLESKKAIQEVWKETNQQLQSMMRASRVGVPVISISLGVIGGIVGTLAGLPGMLFGALEGVFSSLRCARPIAERLVKIGKPTYITAVYDLKRNSKNA